MFKSWFNKTLSAYNGFVKALLVGDIESMNEYMNRVTRGVISYFDTGKNPSDEASERFYHGLEGGSFQENPGANPKRQGRVKNATNKRKEI